MASDMKFSHRYRDKFFLFFQFLAMAVIETSNCDQPSTVTEQQNRKEPIQDPSSHYFLHPG